MRRALLGIALALALALPAATSAAPAGLRFRPHTIHAGRILHVSGAVGNGCSHNGKVTVISNAFHGGADFAGVNAIFIKIRPSGHFAATTRIPNSRTPGSYSVSARCGGGAFGGKKLHVVA